MPLAGLDGETLARALVTAFAATERARDEVFNLRMGEPGFAEAFLERAHVERYGSRAKPGGVGSTTHVAVIDRDGLAVSLTSSCGSGSGVVVEGTGIIMNNMMGERDLNPGGFFSLPPGARLTSMMAPTIACGGPPPDGELIALGSAGSERLRSAITQVLVNIIDRGLPAQEAVDAPRLHLPPSTEQPTVVQLEPGLPDGVAPEPAGRRPSHQRLAGPRPLLRRRPGGRPPLRLRRHPFRRRRAIPVEAGWPSSPDRALGAGSRSPDRGRPPPGLPRRCGRPSRPRGLTARPRPRGRGRSCWVY